MLAPTQPPDHQQLIEAIHQAVEVELREWQAVKHGRRKQSPLFGFVRELRKYPAFDGLDGPAALAQIRATLARTGEALDQLFDDVGLEIPSAILVAWPVADFAGLLGRAVRAVDGLQRPIHCPVSLGYWRFREVCKYIHLQKGGQPIILAVERVAGALGVDRRTITNWKRLAEAEGWLKLAVSADRRYHRAGRYRYIGP